MKTFEDGMKEFAKIVKEAITKKMATQEDIYRICEDILGVKHDERGYYREEE